MIVPVSSLGAALAKKVKQKVSQTCSRIISIHLDEITSHGDATSIIESTLALPLNTKKTVILFSSLQAIVDKPHWKRFVWLLVQIKLLRLIVVDEIQLFVHYGLSFRSQFGMMSTTLFKQIRGGLSSTKILVLFMTVSCTCKMFVQLHILTALNFHNKRRNVFWPSSDSIHPDGRRRERQRKTKVLNTDY